ncbi:unnamed protein product [Protopolystoma xenopodis]|uniref:protein-histidine N-methyltransferase n=1 Tax=Protopolystoma xenopodis TaxID=117903 RepID=A0A448WG05_9PLAT|nr:unnamed protein product [Protopolystoma xenopodis]
MVCFLITCHFLEVGAVTEHPKSVFRSKNGLELYYISEKYVADRLQSYCTEEERVVFSQNMDVKPGIVEGGLTLWNGSIDLIGYLELSEKLDFRSKRVLEVGCGCGLPGIFALKSGAMHVMFQDYNDFVLKAWTIPNVLCNVLSLEKQSTTNFVFHKDVPKSSASFISGDWLHLSREDPTDTYDVILSTETIYRSSLYYRLLAYFESKLARRCSLIDNLPTIYLSCKSIYHTGENSGNLVDFLSAVDQRSNFTYVVIPISTIGVMKYIVKLTWKSKQ